MPATNVPPAEPRGLGGSYTAGQYHTSMNRPEHRPREHLPNSKESSFGSQHNRREAQRHQAANQRRSPEERSIYSRPRYEPWSNPLRVHQAVVQRPSGSGPHGRGHDRRRGPNAANDGMRSRPHAEDEIAQLIRDYLQGEDRGVEEPSHSQSPFTPNILFARNLLDFKLPTMRPYDGTSDPLVYVLKYEQHMEFAEASKEIMSKCFPIYMTDLATMWFCRLDPGSIDSYAQLV